MGNWVLVIALVLCSGVLSSSGNHTRRVIRLGFDGVRGNQTSRTPQLPSSFDHLESQLPNATLVFCTDSEYPNDVFCDIDDLKSDPGAEDMGDIRRLELVYPYAGDPGKKCVVVMNPSGVNSSEFIFEEAHCVDQRCLFVQRPLTDCPHPIHDETLPAFNFSSVLDVRINAGHEYLRIFEVALRRVGVEGRSIVPYVQRGVFRSNFFMGRQQSYGRESASYGHDGRRIQPAMTSSGDN